MEKIEKNSRIEAVRSYLEAIGHPVSVTQAHEVLARSLGYKNKHVLSAQTSAKDSAPGANKPTASFVTSIRCADGKDIDVLPLSAKPFTVDRMQAMNWQFDVVVPVPLDYLGEIHTLNDYVSRFITGDDAALEDTKFEHIPSVGYGQGFVAQRVQGCVSAPEEFFEEVLSQADVQFYEELKQLAESLKNSQTLVLVESEKRTACQIVDIDQVLLSMFAQYAVSGGANNVEVNEVAENYVLALVAQNANPADKLALPLAALKYATKIDRSTWSIPLNSRSLRLQF